MTARVLSAFLPVFSKL